MKTFLMTAAAVLALSAGAASALDFGNGIALDNEVYAAYDGIMFDAAPTVGEDIADISGLAICQEYLRDFHFKNEYLTSIQIRTERCHS